MLAQKSHSSKTLIKILAPLCLLALLALAISPIGCTSNPGVEVGNPTPGSPNDLKDLEITIDPESSEEPELYRVSVLSNTEAEVTKFGETTESLTVPILEAQTGSFAVEATFADGRTIRVEIVFSNSTVTQADLFINSTAIPSIFEVSGNFAGCSTGTTNAPLQIAETLCNRVVFCTTSISCEECRDELINNGGDFGNDLGLAGDESNFTFAEMAEGVDNGELIADPMAVETCNADLVASTCEDINSNFTEEIGNYNNLENIVDCEGVF